MSLADQDISTALDWLDGTLDAQARDAFELRLAAEPELAHKVEQLAHMDDALRRASVRGSANTLRVVRSPRMFLLTAVLVAAALVLALLGWRMWMQPQTARTSFEVALVPSFESPVEFASSIPSLADLHPPGLGDLRGANTPPNTSVADFLARSSEAERLLAARALGSPAPQENLRAGFFVVPFLSPREMSVLVLALPESGEGLRLYPARDLSPTGSDPSPESGRVAAGTHVLPAQRFTLSRGLDSSLHYERGFLVPIGAKSLRVLVAARAERLDGPTLQAIDVALHAGSAGNESLRKLLRERGFEFSERTISEP